MNRSAFNEWPTRALLVSVFALTVSQTRAEHPSAGPAPFETSIRPLLVVHCSGCHSSDAKDPKGKLRVDKLSPDFADAVNRERWHGVLKRVTAGEMPPKAEPRPAAKDMLAVTDWITAGLAATPGKNSGRVALRRLNRIEYENTVRDLLGVDIDLREMLPPDTSANGFGNNGEALHTSSFLMDRYLEAADTALNIAIANLPQPPLVKKRYFLKDERAVKISTESVCLDRPDALVMYSSSGWNAITVGQFYPPARGKYRIRISASGRQSREKPVTFRVDAGPMLMGTKNHWSGTSTCRPTSRRSSSSSIISRRGTTSAFRRTGWRTPRRS